VNDGSQDATLAALHALRLADPHVAVVNLSRNFGKEIATTAGLDMRRRRHNRDRCDLQDPPEVIPAMVRPGGTGSTRSMRSGACGWARRG